MAGEWKGDILIAEDLEKLDASKIYPQTINAKDVLTSQKRDEFKFPVADGTAKLSGKDYEFREPTKWRERTVRSEYLSGELQGEPEGAQPTEPTDNVEAREITLQAKVWLRWPITIWFTSLFLCLKRWKFRMRKQQWRKNGKNWRQTQHGNWRKSRARRRLFSKHKETKRKSTLLHWWTYVTSKTRS